jgi:hypothetical protein
MTILIRRGREYKGVLVYVPIETLQECSDMEINKTRVIQEALAEAVRKLKGVD